MVVLHHKQLNVEYKAITMNINNDKLSLHHFLPYCKIARNVVRENGHYI